MRLDWVLSASLVQFMFSTAFLRLLMFDVVVKNLLVCHLAINIFMDLSNFKSLNRYIIASSQSS